MLRGHLVLRDSGTGSYTGDPETLIVLSGLVAGPYTEEIASIKSQISDSEDTERPKVQFEIGETIKINNGPFLNFSGVIEEVEPERGKLKVTVNIFGRNTPVELEYWQVEKG